MENDSSEGKFADMEYLVPGGATQAQPGGFSEIAPSTIVYIGGTTILCHPIKSD
ncbi:MAG: hypothetical protein MUO26_09895 [Methanotrichaceae archaeon]|nr:hypothetical protein [Methanotrichaceae archaeon]